MERGKTISKKIDLYIIKKVIWHKLNFPVFLKDFKRLFPLLYISFYFFLPPPTHSSILSLPTSSLSCSLPLSANLTIINPLLLRELLWPLKDWLTIGWRQRLRGMRSGGGGRGRRRKGAAAGGRSRKGFDCPVLCCPDKSGDNRFLSFLWCCSYGPFLLTTPTLILLPPHLFIFWWGNRSNSLSHFHVIVTPVASIRIVMLIRLVFFFFRLSLQLRKKGRPTNRTTNRQTWGFIGKRYQR